ncbi:MAG: amidohydrolase family protein [Acidimicrobiia bacterium]
MADVRMIDMDCHYYEPDDAFTRHLDPALRDEALWIDRANGGRVMLGDERLGFQSVAIGDHAAPPGTLKEYFRSKGKLVGPETDGFAAGEVAEFTDRAARLAALDRFDVAACLMLPSWGVGVEPELRARRDVLYPAVRAFNDWVQDDWGFDDGRIVSTALLSLADVDEAVRELDRVIAAGCRAVAVTTGPVDGRSPADPHFDPVYARLQEAGVFLVHHIGATPFCEMYATQWGERAHPPSHRHSVLEMFFGMGERPIADTWAALYAHNLFGRFPELQVVAIEWGAMWLPALLDRLDKLSRAGGNKDSWRFGRPDLDPFETFRRNQWIVPYYEDDIPFLVEKLGDTRLLAGSDFPHPEGLADPNEFAEELTALDAAAQQRIMHDNAATLLARS